MKNAKLSAIPESFRENAAYPTASSERYKDISAIIERASYTQLSCLQYHVLL